jgi:hypothetical protein
MGRSRKKRDYLDALDDPKLPEDRRLALKLVAMARLMRTEDRSPVAVRDVVLEVARQKATLQCQNCGADVRGAATFCDQFCQQQATVVRHVRKALVDGRIEESAMQIAVGIRLRMLITGGYPKRERILSREYSPGMVWGGEDVCLVCGRAADQIGGSGGDPDDTDEAFASCAACSRLESFGALCLASGLEHTSLEQIFIDLAQRISARVPVLFCDDYENWKRYQPSIRLARSRLVREREVEEEADYVTIGSYLTAAMLGSH